RGRRARGAGRGRLVPRGHRGPPSARGPPAVRGAGLRRRRDGLPAQAPIEAGPDRQTMTLPRLVLRDEVADLLALPWERPLGSRRGTDPRFREMTVSPSRHLVP